ncbi:EAL domain-containing protein [Flavobacterium sp. MXW15]|uniref:EAL domain-containing protein n=1 Tax=Xanthomonas chitinilytica TaxID=2989819 RepID=A0ABT3JTN2_9XANT|nr:EAL domain-containing protein [Xanthomonas sp. H13-6]MCW4454615.1 EAL domain-containing protein [Flavobacterium sp. MXW15]MCW4471854.1 EAL domain-containing protein [Xanthomonas sp. H13-6]
MPIASASVTPHTVALAGWIIAAVLAAAAIAAAILALGLRRRLRQLQQHNHKLRHRDQHLKLALWASGEQFWDYDLQQRRLHWMRADELAPASAEITMVMRDGSGPKIHRSDLPQVLRRLNDHVEGRAAVFLSEHRMDLDGNGQWLWVRVRGRVVERDPDGRPLRVAGTARDISAHRRADAERRIASEVLHSMNEAVAVLDRNLRFVSVNPAFSRITGYGEPEVVGQPLHMLDHSPDTPAQRAQLLQALRQSGHWNGDTWKRRKDGREILCHVRHNLVRDIDGRRSFHVVVLEDITEQKRAEQELRYLANYDTLTSLPNRALASERLARAIVRARREERLVAVLFLDLDRFKDINDSLGHPMGDRVLRAAAERVQQAVGPQHTVARLSGDEFTVILEDIASQAQAEEVARQVLAAFEPPLQLDERREVAMSPSIGISLYPQHALVPSELLKHADTAMYQAKAAGRSTYQVYSARMDEQTRHRATLASTLRKIPFDRELKLVYQPRYSLIDRRVVGVEALVRWHSAEFGLVSPSQFIPLAEETGLILEIGEWVLRQACATLRDWREQGQEDLCMSVNVSAIQLQRGDLPDLLARILGQTGVRPGQLELELTESAVMGNVAANAAILRACRDQGVGLAIDDFGTGYSSLAYLKRLPLTTLKIDREFVRDLTLDPDDEAITSAIIAMGHSLSLKVVAEGVESHGQLAFLHENGCDEIQGHLVAPALEQDACLRFLQQAALTAH